MVNITKYGYYDDDLQEIKTKLDRIESLAENKEGKRVEMVRRFNMVITFTNLSLLVVQILLWLLRSIFL